MTSLQPMNCSTDILAGRELVVVVVAIGGFRQIKLNQNEGSNAFAGMSICHADPLGTTEKYRPSTVYISAETDRLLKRNAIGTRLETSMAASFILTPWNPTNSKSPLHLSIIRTPFWI